jgi:hypothetical protein
MKAALLAAAVLAAAGVMLHFGNSVPAAKAAQSTPSSQSQVPSQLNSVAHSLSLPMFFEPNQGQTAPQVKFMARGAGYGLFLTADEAVLKLQQAVPGPRTATPIPSPKPASVIRMRLEGANLSAQVSGTSPLPGKSNYFIGNDRSQWRQNIPQFARVQYQAVYPGVDLVYYGDQGQLEYDFRIAPGSDPNQIALSFTGANVHVDSESSGDLVLSTANGDIRFHAPHVYQPDAGANASGNVRGTAEKTVAGNFRQLADNKIGFAIGDYDHSRELVIDPVLSYSTYLGGGGESLVKIAVDSASNIYVAGSTTSPDFPLSGSSSPYIPPLQTALGGSGAQNLFISKINPTPQSGNPQLVFSTYLGGSGTDSLAGIAIDQSLNIYVAGSTTSPNFPTTGNAYQKAPQSGSHGFVTAITFNSKNSTYALTYSTYLAGNGVDAITGMAIDNSCQTSQAGVAACNEYVTGVTTSSNTATQLNPFPASPEGFQIQSNSPGNGQFFATKIYTAGSGYASIAYSTYFGGGNFGASEEIPDIAVGGGIAVDPSAIQVNMYFTGTTNQLGVAGPDGTAAFPLYNAQQSCLNEAGQTNCSSQNPTQTTDAFAAKIYPAGGSIPVYSTYLGGSGSDNGNAIAVDTTGNTYVVGATNSNDWIGVGGGFQPALYQGAMLSTNYTNAFIAKIGSSNGSGTVFPLTYFTYLGGAGPDIANDIKVDSVQAAHVVGTTSSSTLNPPSFPITAYAYQACLGEPNGNPPPPPPCTGDPYTASDAFVALISTTISGAYPNNVPPGDYTTYLGGSGIDQGTGIALDINNLAYVAGVTQSTNFPVTAGVFQPTLVGTQDAFVTKLGANSGLLLGYPNTSPNPQNVAAGTQVAFTFDIVNQGPDNATSVIFNATGVPLTGLTKPATAQVTSNSGSCTAVQGSGTYGTISCFIPTLAVCTPLPCANPATVEVDMTPESPVVNSTITVSGTVSANGGPVSANATQPNANVVDFSVSAATPTPVNAGDIATILVTFCPTSSYGYNATITPSQTTSPSMVTSTTPTFTPTTVTLAGVACRTTTLSIPTVARPQGSGSLLRRFPFYATWLPIGGLSLVGLGIGAGRKHRRWLVGAVLCVIMGILVLWPGCGKSTNSATTPGGTVAQTYTIQITGTAGAASHLFNVYLQVN